MFKVSKSIQKVLLFPVLMGIVWLPQWWYLLVLLFTTLISTGELYWFFTRCWGVVHPACYDLATLVAGVLILMCLVGIVCRSIALYQEFREQYLSQLANSQKKACQL